MCSVKLEYSRKCGKFWSESQLLCTLCNFSMTSKKLLMRTIHTKTKISQTAQHILYIPVLINISIFPFSSEMFLPLVRFFFFVVWEEARDDNEMVKRWKEWGHVVHSNIQRAIEVVPKVQSWLYLKVVATESLASFPPLL